MGFYFLDCTFWVLIKWLDRQTPITWILNATSLIVVPITIIHPYFLFNFLGSDRLGKVNLLLWKFTYLDANADYMLEPSELHSFLKKTKKAIHPKKCSKTFIGYCDEDGSVKVSLSEWYTCLGVQGNIVSVSVVKDTLFITS